MTSIPCVMCCASHEDAEDVQTSTAERNGSSVGGDVPDAADGDLAVVFDLVRKDVGHLNASGSAQVPYDPNSESGVFRNTTKKRSLWPSELVAKSSGLRASRQVLGELQLLPAPYPSMLYEQIGDSLPVHRRHVRVERAMFA